MADDAFKSPDDVSPSLLSAFKAIASPWAWWEARRSDVVTLFAVLALVSVGVAGVRHGVGVTRMFLAMQTLGATYDASYDPVLVEHGQVRVLGPRLPVLVTPQQALIVDPDETIAIDTIASDQYIVVRRDVVIRQRAFGPPQLTPVSDLQEALGVDPLRIDGASLDGWVGSYGLLFAVASFLFALAVTVLADLCGCALYAGAAAGAIGLLDPTVPSPDRFRVALAASTATIVPSSILTALGVGMSCCSNLLVWPVLITALAGLGITLGRARGA